MTAFAKGESFPIASGLVGCLIALLCVLVSLAVFIVAIPLCLLGCCEVYAPTPLNWKLRWTRPVRDPGGPDV